MDINRDDVRAGKVLPRWADGVWVVPSLRINTATLREHNERLGRERQRPLTDEEVARLYLEAAAIRSERTTAPVVLEGEILPPESSRS